MLDPDDEPSKHEPPEFDPHSLGPKTPSVPNTADNADNADPETANLFWILVIVFNVALMGLSIGPMFIVFQGRWVLGSQLFLGGAILFAYGYYRYRQFNTD